MTITNDILAIKQETVSNRKAESKRDDARELRRSLTVSNRNL